MAKSKFETVLSQRKTVNSALEPERPPTLEKAADQRKRGRPPGKRTHPDYQQVTVYLPRALYDQVKIKLIQEGRKEFSELVENLLINWLYKRKG